MANTGPSVEPTATISAAQFADSRTCSDQRVTGDVFLWGSELRDTTWSINGCVFEGRLVVTPEVGAGGGRSTWSITDSEFEGIVAFNNPANVRIDRSALLSTLQLSPTDATGNLDWANTWDFPVTVTNSYVYASQGLAGDHTEALAGWGWPRGVTFVNSSFVQEGPFNGTATATVNWHGADTVFDGCWFYWEDGTAAYYTVYVEGPNNVVRNSRLERGLGSYIYPNSSPLATYTGNTDLATGAPVGL